MAAVKREYRRHLPHQVPAGAPIFLTWNLKGAIPREVVERLERERQHLSNEPRRSGESPSDRALRQGKLIFARTDDYLDSTSVGPLRLREPPIARIVEDSILFGAGERYSLFAWCVMANHVHVLLTPIWELAKITQGIKGYTAWKINQLRVVGQPFQTDTASTNPPAKRPRDHDPPANVRLESLTYNAFWQDESYDHWVRDEDELLRIIHYIENNPVKAGLCEHPQDWPWSSARRHVRWPVGQPFQADFLEVPG